jgi:hypothetical protein
MSRHRGGTGSPPSSGTIVFFDPAPPPLTSPVHAADFDEFRMSQKMTTENGKSLQLGL